MKRSTFVATGAMILLGCQQGSTPMDPIIQDPGRLGLAVGCVAVPSDVVSWWPGDGDADDAAGSNDGTLQNGATFAAGQVGEAFDLDGANDYVSIPNESVFDFTSALTVEGWIKVDSWVSDFAPIVAKGDSSWRIQRHGNRNWLAFGTTGLSNVDLEGTANVNDGAWHHVAAVFDGATKYLYVDGDLDASAAVTGTIATNDFEVRIGNNSQETTRFWDGRIDEITVYDRALSEAEIDAIYAAGTAGKCKDGDGDGVTDDVDNCPNDANPDQSDMDGDGPGDVCEESHGSARGSGLVLHDPASDVPGATVRFAFTLSAASPPSGRILYTPTDRKPHRFSGGGTDGRIDYLEVLGDGTIYAAGTGLSGRVSQGFCLIAVDAGPSGRGDTLELRLWRSNVAGLGCTNPSKRYFGALTSGDVVAESTGG